MFATETELVNMALGQIGVPPMTALSTDQTKEAEAARAVYAHTRDTTLSAHPWNFAGYRVALVASANAPEGQWGFRYTYPTNALMIRGIYRDSEKWANPRVPFEIAYDATGSVRTIHCDIDPAFAHITRQITDVTKFSQVFSEVLYWQVAAVLAIRLARDRRLRADTIQLAANALERGKALDSNERYVGPPGHEPETVVARR